MSYSNNDIRLNNCDDEDISDLILKLEKSFGLKFEKNALESVNTFGELCDVFENHMPYEHRDDCTTQQAFYRIRDAIAATQQVNKNVVKPDTRLEYLFSRHDRPFSTWQFKNYLGIEIKMLTYPNWLGLTCIFGLLLSFPAFFFDWKIGLAGVVFFVTALSVEENLGKALTFQTVRELTEKIASENYLHMRRQKGTINKREIVQTIVDTFSQDLDLDRKYLTRNDEFGWAK